MMHVAERRHKLNSWKKCKCEQTLCLTAKVVWCMQVERYLTVHQSLNMSTLPDSGLIEVQLPSHVLPPLKVRCSDIK